jgi:hypothetical protein
MRRFPRISYLLAKARNNIRVSEAICISGSCFLVACVYCHMPSMSGLKGVSLLYMVEPCPYGMVLGCYWPFGPHILHVLKPMYIIDRRGGCRASDASLFAERTTI